ncbi:MULTISPECIES: GTP 3',8-cyclase MoaA [Acidithiobacillus]|jgi:cyclic pyranopterin phosphate synthase|uniref:GTP 3',8-cyclase n=3 Tax=Acidithiobacillus caldus TaxID=33059 RepID=F9ZRQ4_ACICS|nr:MULTISPECIES: GTP 3',8-cyclase MoaA [Acidithiobacillus]AEK59004.1 molybdenum cofactor biosynthesis protein A [Acidithiobacillus caldus SM-1]AUW33403.1 GTP 3',8-cyclase MoaA [Acidithiobacillus caldus]MBU2730725.1 GTP 3',8-cyclase MoaA [Acidithiobacillus caldus]MBU2736254.1 GTP 3',8-cyclase MoaA [Acidithiobacillus caldus ATCC 51756]MBU2744608.1 GTP 3',8-cyclase MoaA [Acidithiobacillus caldus]
MRPGPRTSAEIGPPRDGLQDRFGRRITYLRVSLTEHCNFRCQYCTPEDGTPYFDRAEHLQRAELVRLLQLFVGMGLQHLRLTGGEPLIHPHVVDYVRAAKAMGIGKISISSNGLLLARLAPALREAGLNNLNISLDALDPEIFRSITRGGDLARVLRGIAAAQEAGIPRIKLNTVLLGKDNRSEILPLTEYALRHGLDLRFIETMPLGSAGSAARDAQYLPAAEARAIIEAHYGPLHPVAAARDHGPARLFQVGQASTRIGFITPISENFCANCNRVRLTAHGRLVYCLGQEAGLDLRELLRDGSSDDDLRARIRAGIWHDKPERHEFLDNRERSSRVFMMRLGG